MLEDTAEVQEPADRATISSGSNSRSGLEGEEPEVHGIGVWARR